MITVTGNLYLITHDNGTTVNVNLDWVGEQKTQAHVALLVATLYRAGYAPVQHGDSVIFKVTGPDVRHGGVGRAFDAIGRALGGVSYRFSVAHYQEQNGSSEPDGVTMERFKFRATGPATTQPWQVESEDIETGDLGNDYDDVECG